MEPDELLALIRSLREKRQLKHEEETAEDVSLEKLKLRVLRQLNRRSQVAGGESAA
jgi:hypothetical protein